MKFEQMINMAREAFLKVPKSVLKGLGLIGIESVFCQLPGREIMTNIKSFKIRFAALFVLFFYVLLFCSGPALCAKLAIYTEDSAPANFVQNGTLTGLCVDIVREMQERIGDQTAIRVVPWSRGLSYLQSRANTMLFATTKAVARSDNFHWVGPLIRIKWFLFGLKDREYDIQCLEDAKQFKSIGTYIDDAKDQFLRARGFDNLVPVRDNLLNLRKIVRGRLDLFVSSDVGIKPLLRQSGISANKIVPIIEIKKADLYLAFSRNTDPEILHEWKQAFASVVRDGTFLKIYKKWLPDLHPPEPDCCGLHEKFF